jgi:hypothetical protein
MNTKTFLPIILVLVTGIFCVCQGGTLYTCDFSQDSGWAAVPTQGNIFSISGGLCHGQGLGGSQVAYFFHTQNFDNFTYSVDMAFDGANDKSDMGGICFRMSDARMYLGYFLYISNANQVVLNKITYDTEFRTSEVVNSYHSYILPDNNVLTVSADGSRIRFYVNKELVFDTTDSEYTAGNIGLCIRDSAKIIFDNVLVKSEIDSDGYSQKFDDNFDDGDLDNWMQTKITGNEVATFENTGSALRATGGESPVYYQFITSGEYQNFTLSVNTTIEDVIDTNDSYMFGLLFRGNHFGRGYYFGITENRFYGLSKITDTGVDPLVRSSSPNTNISLSQNALKVRAAGDSIYIYANNVPLYSCTDNEFSQGDVGVFVTSNLSITFDDFSLVHIPTTVFSWMENQGNRGISISAFPNPFATNVNIRCSAENWAQGIWNVGIYDVSGKLVFSQFPTANSPMVWDGFDNNGKMVSPGIYFVHIKNGSAVSSKRLDFMR